MIMEYIRQHWFMRLTLSTCNSRISIAAREYALRYLGGRHPATDVFRLLE